MPPLKIAVISTPRSGNTWVRRVLSQALDLDQIAVHNPRDIPLKLPERVALQIHWYREPNFQAFLRAKGFRVIVIARHPLDVLTSVLRFARYEPLTARWLEGNVDLPPDLPEYPPASPAFLAYATSWGAANLLSVSYQWWHEPAAVRVHYERLVLEPVTAFGDLFERLHQPFAKVTSALDANPLRLLQDTPNRHGWQARPGLWRDLVLPVDAWRIFRGHRHIFEALSYGLSPYLLTRRTALRNWHRLAA